MVHHTIRQNIHNDNDKDKDYDNNNDNDNYINNDNDNNIDNDNALLETKEIFCSYNIYLWILLAVEK